MTIKRRYLSICSSRTEKRIKQKPLQHRLKLLEIAISWAENTFFAVYGFAVWEKQQPGSAFEIIPAGSQRAAS